MSAIQKLVPASVDVHRRSLASVAFGSVAIFSKNWVVRYRIKLFGPAFTFVWQGLQHSIPRNNPEKQGSCRPLYSANWRKGVLLRKEVIQPQVPLRLPCYDFIPVTAHTLGPCLLAVGTDTSGTSDSHDVTGGVYKARERIHGAVADAPLLAIPASCRRVAAYNPNWAQFY
jgi:hypothetical protein